MDSKSMVSADRKKTSKTISVVVLAYHVLSFTLIFVKLWLDGTMFSIITGLIFPLLGVALVAFSGGSIKFLATTTREHRSAIMLGFMISTVFLFAIAHPYYHFLYHSEMWLPFGITATVISIAIYFSGIHHDAQKRKWHVLFMIVWATLYSFGAITIVNCEFDDSAPMKFNTSVQSKHTSKSKGNAYYHLTLNPWQRHQDPIEIDVTRTEYEQTPVDGPVGGHIKRGLLGIKWFYLDM